MPKARRQPTIYAEQNAVRRLAIAREERAIPVRRLAEMLSAEGCPMHASAVSDTLNGSRRLSVDELVAFARVLEIPLALLVDPTTYAAEEMERLQARAQFATAAMEFADEYRARAQSGYERAVKALHNYWIQHPEGRPTIDANGQVNDLRKRNDYGIDKQKSELRRALDEAAARLQPE